MHLQLINSHFFDVRGQQKSSIEKNPIKISLIESLANIGFDRNTYVGETMLSSMEMDIARSVYITKFKIMWDKKMFNALLNHLLDMLLRVHLASKRVKKYKEMIKAKKENALKKTQQNQKETFSRNITKSLVRAETKNLEKYKLKSNERKIRKSQFLQKQF